MTLLGPSDARCRVFTRREGVLKAMGHDLELQVTDFSLRFSQEERTVSGVFQTDALRVVGVAGSASLAEGGLSDTDVALIERHVRDDVLNSRRFPTITFEAAGLHFEQEPETVAGSLELRGVTRSLAVRTRLRDGVWVATATIHQPDFGMKPFGIMLGGLRVHMDVTVEISVAAERLSGIPPAS
jgi:polyisoprenoid-binding protein YceI